jgi:hypothetical protein
MARPTDQDSFVRELRKLSGRAANGQLQSTLGWNKDKYWLVHAQLYGDGVIEKGRGYGGTVILIEPPENGAAAVEPPSVVRAKAVTVGGGRIDSGSKAETATIAAVVEREIELYEPVRSQLERNWAQRRQLDHCHCEITAMQGRRETGGSWSRPDLALIGYRKYEFLPEKVFELFSFEVKPENDVSIKGVMEALAHREAATRSFVIYHTAGKDFAAFPEADRIEELAAKHGVGV